MLGRIRQNIKFCLGNVQCTIEHVQCLQENLEIEVDGKSEMDINHMMKEELYLTPVTHVQSKEIFNSGHQRARTF